MNESGTRSDDCEKRGFVHTDRYGGRQTARCIVKTARRFSPMMRNGARLGGNSRQNIADDLFAGTFPVNPNSFEETKMNTNLEAAIVALAAAVMSLARDVNRISPNALSDETSEKCVDATCAIGKAIRKDGGV